LALLFWPCSNCTNTPPTNPPVNTEFTPNITMEPWVVEKSLTLHDGIIEIKPIQKVRETLQVRSQNWSGYSAVSPHNNTVEKVVGSWVIPTISPSSVDTYMSQWVGLDGYNPTSRTVQQLGTECDWDTKSNSQVNYVWFEMYPNYSYMIHGFPISPGDIFQASVTYLSGRYYQLTIANLTKRVYYTVPLHYSTVPAGYTATRSSAEWILEAPYSGGILPLAQFSPTSFNNCLVTMQGKTGSISGGSWQNNQITMISATGSVKALPSNLYNSGKGFSVAYFA
jgi:hypothetical protein